MRRVGSSGAATSTIACDRRTWVVWASEGGTTADGPLQAGCSKTACVFHAAPPPRDEVTCDTSVVFCVHRIWGVITCFSPLISPQKLATFFPVCLKDLKAFSNPNVTDRRTHKRTSLRTPCGEDISGYHDGKMMVGPSRHSESEACI